MNEHLKEINNVKIPPVLRDDLGNKSDIEFSIIDGNTKVDNNLGNEGKFSIQMIANFYQASFPV